MSKQKDERLFRISYFRKNNFLGLLFVQICLCVKHNWKSAIQIGILMLLGCTVYKKYFLKIVDNYRDYIFVIPNYLSKR